MKPLTAFRQNIKAAEKMIRLHELLAGKNVRGIRKERAAALKKALRWRKADQIDRSENAYLYIVIRRADAVTRSDFGAKQLEFLLRQAVVAACSAMDCYFLEKVEEHIWTVYSKKGAESPPDLLRLRIRMEDYLKAEGYTRKGWAIKAGMMNSIQYSSFQSPDAIKDRLQLLGVKDFWSDVARELGRRPSELRNQVKEFVERRNQIVHKGDRPRNKTLPIDLNWVRRRTALVDRVVNAADSVIDRQVAAL